MKNFFKGKKLIVNPPVGNRANCWKPAKIKNSDIDISPNGLEAMNTSNATVYVYYRSVSAEKGFNISADFPGPVLLYFEVTIMSAQYKG
jgi:hypothetical protein